MGNARRRVRHYAALLALVLWSIAALNLVSPGAASRNGHVKGEDYVHFYGLGRLADEGRLTALYDPAVQAAFLTSAIPGAPATYFIPVYGPQVALLFQPFARVSYFPSLMLWWIASLALYAACGYAIWRTLGPLRRYPAEVALLAIASPALWQLLLHGQNSAVALASLTGGWMCLRASRPIAAGLVFGVLAYKPQLALAAMVVFTVAGHWRVVAAMGASALLQFAMVYLVLGGAVIADYTAMLARLPQVIELIEPKLYLMHSFRAFFMLLPPVSAYAIPLSIVFSLAALFVVVRHWLSRSDPDVSFALLLVATVLVSPHTSVYDLVLLMPALLILVDRQLVSDEDTTIRDRPAWFLLTAIFILPLASHSASWTYVQPTVICLAWLLVRHARASFTPRVELASAWKNVLHRRTQAAP